MEIQAWRSRFPIVSRCIYLNNNAMGAMLESTHQQLSDFLTRWEMDGGDAWDTWFPQWMKACGLFAALVGAQPGDICLTANVSTATAAILSALDFTGKRRTIVTTSEEFPSVRYVYDAWAKYGARVVAVDAAAVADAIDDETLLVGVSHVQSFTGRAVYLQPIAEAAHRHGALLYVDAYQSFGVMPLDVTQLGIDLLASGVVKWACGGPGSAFLYVAPHLQARLQPALCGWLGHAQPFAFVPDMQYAPSAQRFTTGIPSVPSLYTAVAGLEMLTAVSIPAIRARNSQLTAQIIALADQHGIAVASPRRPEERGGHVVLQPPGAEQVVAQLIESGIRVDYRPGRGIRMAPHFYNTEAEIDTAMSALALFASAEDAG